MKLVKEISTDSYKIISDSELLTNPLLYIDRSNKIVYWFNHYKEASILYWQMRYQVKLIHNNNINGFNGFINSEKEILSTLGIGDQNQIITYFMSVKLLDLNTSKGLLIYNLANNTSKLANDAKLINLSPKIMTIGIKYLTWADPITGLLDSTQANNLTYALQGFLTEYERYAIVGLNYGAEREGIMDYLESTNSYLSGGLKNYVFSPDMITLHTTQDAARLAMIVELQDVFVSGNI